MYSEQLEQMIQSVIEKGFITEEEWATLYVKAKEEGVNEEEIYKYVNGLLQKTTASSDEANDKKNDVGDDDDEDDDEDDDDDDVYDYDDDDDDSQEKIVEKPRMTDEEASQYNNFKLEIKCKGSLFFNGKISVNGVNANYFYKYLGWWPFKNIILGWRGFVRSEEKEVDLRDVMTYSYIHDDGYLYFGSEESQIETTKVSSGKAKDLLNFIEKVSHNFQGQGQVLKSTITLMDILLFPFRLTHFFLREKIVLMPKSILYIEPRWIGRNKTMLNYSDINRAFVTIDSRIWVLGKQNLGTKFKFTDSDCETFIKRMKKFLLKDTKTYTESLHWGYSPTLFLAKDVVIFENKNELSILRYENIDCYFRKSEGLWGLLGFGTVYISGEGMDFHKERNIRITMKLKRVYFTNWKFLFFALGIKDRLNNSEAKNKKSVKKSILKN